MSWLVEKKISAGFGFAMVILIVMGGVAWWSVTRSLEGFYQVEESRRVLSAQAELLREVTDLEVVVRGYFVTGNPIYLEQYQPGIEAVHRSLNELRQLAGADDLHRHRLTELTAAIARKFDVMHNYMTFRDNNTAEEVFRQMRRIKGKLVADEVRVQISAIARAERQRLTDRADAARGVSVVAARVVLLSGLMAVLIVGLAHSAARRDLHRRLQAERDLRETQADLERRVRERTAEVIAFATLGRQLNECTEMETAGRLIVDVADRLFSYDACSFILCEAQRGTGRFVLNRDLINGRRADVPSAYSGAELSPRLRRVMEQGAELILRTEPLAASPDLVPFGDTSRPSASLMIVPIYDGQKAIGVLSLQSYRTNAYTRANLDSLQALADHCGGALSRIQSRADMQQERNLLRTLIDIIPDSIYVRDLDNRFVIANEAVARNMGVPSAAALLGRTDTDFYDADQAAKLARDDREVLAGQTKINFEEEILSPGGERWVVLSSKVPLRDASGTVTGLVGIGRNITERKRMEEALRTVTDTAQVGLVIVDTEHRYRYANPAYAKILRLPTHEIVGQRVADVLANVYATQIRPRLERAFSGQRVTYELTVPPAGPGDSPRHYAVAYEPGSDRPDHVVVVVMDITERRQAEERADWLASFPQRNPNPVIELDLADGVIHYLNPAAQHLFPELESEGLNHPLLSGIREIARPVVEGSLGKLHREVTAGSYVFSQTLNYVPELHRLRVYSTDITERQQAERRLEESRTQLRALLVRLQRAQEEERIRVAREVHDELGQLLTGLKMDTRWLERKLSDPGLPSELAPLFDRAVAASELADTTIATVRKIAAELRPGALDQLGLAAALTQRARLFGERSGVRCAVTAAEFEPPLPPPIACELFYICQEALTNVARHAQASQVVIHLAPEGGAAVLRVSDDGVGLAERDLSAPRSLGLVGMRERAIQCGGSVTFERNEPRGTSVVVRVPLVTAAANGGAAS